MTRNPSNCIAPKICLERTLLVQDGLVLVKPRGANSSDVRAGVWIAGVEDSVTGPEAAVLCIVTGEGGDAVVSCRDQNRCPLEAELHELVTLALLVVGGQVPLGLAIGDGDDVRRLVHTALELALVTPWIWVGVVRIDTRGISSNAECSVVAVTAIESVKKCVQVAIEERFGVSTRLIRSVPIICLVKDRLLRPDERVCHGKVDIRLSSVVDAVRVHGCLGAVDELVLGMRSSGDLRDITSEEPVQVGLRVGIPRLVNAHLVSFDRRGAIGDLVQVLDAGGGDVPATIANLWRQNLRLRGRDIRSGAGRRDLVGDRPDL